MQRREYPAEIKWEVVKEKLAESLTNKQIKDKYGIKNNSQIKTWIRWYRNNDLHRFDSANRKTIHLWART